MRGQISREDLLRVPECKSIGKLSAYGVMFDEGGPTFLISSALRCSATSFVVLTTGMAMAI